MKRLVLAAVLLAIATFSPSVLGCNQQTDVAVDDEPIPLISGDPSLASDDYAVISLAIHSESAGPEHVVVASSTLGAAIVHDVQESMEFLHSYWTAEDKAAVENLFKRNADSVHLADTLDEELKYRLVSTEAITALGEIDAGWEQRLSRANSGASELIRVSLPGFSADGNTAVVHVVVTRGYLNAHGTLVYLTKQKSGWTVTDRDSLWVS